MLGTGNEFGNYMYRVINSNVLKAFRFYVFVNTKHAKQKSPRAKFRPLEVLLPFSIEEIKYKDVTCPNFPASEFSPDVYSVSFLYACILIS